MGLAVRRAAAHRGADSGGVHRIAEIHVEREMEPGGAGGRDADGLIHHGAQAALVDIAHGEGADAAVAHLRFLGCVHIAQPDDDGMARIDLGTVAQQVDEFGRPGAQNARQRHAVDVAAGTAAGRIHIGVRVQPD
jgi:hypothetical protein